jgi:hypothetical protein
LEMQKSQGRSHQPAAQHPYLTLPALAMADAVAACGIEQALASSRRHAERAATVGVSIRRALSGRADQRWARRILAGDQEQEPWAMSA